MSTGSKHRYHIITHTEYACLPAFQVPMIGRIRVYSSNNFAGSLGEYVLCWFWYLRFTTFGSITQMMNNMGWSWTDLSRYQGGFLMVGVANRYSYR